MSFGNNCNEKMLKQNLNHPDSLFLPLLANRVRALCFMYRSVHTLCFMYRDTFPSSTFPHVVSYLSAASSDAFPPSSSRSAPLNLPLPFLTVRRNTSFPVSLSHSHLPLHTSLSLSPCPFLPLHPSFLSFSLFVPLSVQPSVAIETDLFEIGGKGNYFSLLPPFHSILGHRVASPVAFIQLILTLFICANHCWSYCCHDYCGNIDIILHTVTMATSRVISRALC